MLLLRRPSFQPAPGARVTPSRRAGVTHAWPCNEPFGTIVHDAVPGGLDLTAHSTTSFGSGKFGWGLKLAAGANDYASAAIANLTNWGPTTQAPCTVLCTFQPNTTASGEFLSIGSTTGDGTPNILFNKNSSDLRIFTIAGYRTLTNAFATVGVPHRIGVVLNGDQTAFASTTARCYCDGQLYQTVTGGDSSQLAHNGNIFVGIGFNGTPNGIVGNVQIINRALSPDEMMRDAIDPWTIFAQTMRLPFDPAGAAVDLPCGAIMM